jgi:hypothetical protein
MTVVAFNCETSRRDSRAQLLPRFLHPVVCRRDFYHIPEFSDPSGRRRIANNALRVFDTCIQLGGSDTKKEKGVSVFVQISGAIDRAAHRSMGWWAFQAR